METIVGKASHIDKLVNDELHWYVVFEDGTYLALEGCRLVGITHDTDCEDLEYDTNKLIRNQDAIGIHCNDDLLQAYDEWIHKQWAQAKLRADAYEKVLECVGSGEVQ